MNISRNVIKYMLKYTGFQGIVFGDSVTYVRKTHAIEMTVTIK